MDHESQQTLARLLRAQRIAALGTLRDGAPFVSMVPFVASSDLTQYYLHVSGLAYHTKDMVADPRVSLMITEADAADRDPQTLARLSIRGEAMPMSRSDADYAAAEAAYLERFPQARFNFSLGDFSLYRIEAARARYVAGFGKIFNLGPADLQRAAEGDAD